MTKFYKLIKRYCFIAQLLILVIAYFVTGKLGMFLAVPPGYATAVYPPSGIALAGILILGYRAWFGILLGSFLLNLSIAESHTSVTNYMPIVIAFIIAIGATLQAIVGTYLVKHFANFPNPLANEKNVFMFMFYGGFLSTLVNSTISVSTLVVMNQVPIANFFTNWSTWWMGDAIGIFIFSPLVLVWLYSEHDYFKHRKLIISSTILLAFSITVMLVAFETNRERERLKTEFYRDAAMLNVALDKSIVAHLSLLRSLESFYAASENVGRNQFHEFVTKALIDFKDVQALGWNLVVADAQRKMFEKSVQKEGFPNFEINERDVNNNLIRANNREFYVPATFIEPLKNNEPALGYDVNSDPIRREAIESARDTGEIATTSKITLVQDNQAGILTFVPIYKNHLPHQSLQERRQNILGYALAVFHINDIFTGALSHTHFENLHLQLFDDNALTQEQHLLFSNQSTPFVLSEKGLFGRNISLTSSVLIKMGNRQWRFEITPTQDYFVEHRSDNSWLILFGGLILTSLSGIYIMVSTGREMVLQQLVAERTKDFIEIDLELKRSNMRLQKENDKTLALLRNASDGIHILNYDGNVIECSESFCTMLGYSREDVIGMHVSQWDAGIPKNEIMEVLHAQFEKITRTQFETRHRRKNGTIYDVEISGFPIDFDGERVLFNSSRDITERKEIEVNLLASETRFRSIFERASIGIAFTDDSGNILQANQCFLDLIGFTWSELEGVNFSTFTYKDDLVLEQSLFQTILDNKADCYRMEKRYLNKSGLIVWVDVNATVIRNDKNQPINFVGLVIDITERKNVEAKLVEAKQIAENANKTKSDFLANMSHEIRTPMNAVLGLTQLVLETELNHRQRDFLDKVYLSSKALLSVLNDILDYSKIEAGHLNIESIPCHLEMILMNVADLFSAKLAEKSLEIYFEIDSAIPYTILSDPLRINQILNNLVSNAIKFTSHGEIQINVKPLCIKGNVQTLQFSVRDTGIGLSEQQIELLFQPFMQADNSISRKYGGTGLGLAICYRLVHLMNGEISVSSVQNKGSDFSFTIDVQLSKEVENSSIELQKLKGQRVLVVDDQLTSVTILKTLLETWGIEVDTAISGREALDKIQQAEFSKNCFDTILLDWHMPDIDGLEVAKQLRENSFCGRSLVIIMVTAYDKQELFIKSAELNITNILIKPIIPSTVFNALLDNPNHPVHLYQSRKVEKSEKVFLSMRILLVEDHKINQQVATAFLTSRGAIVTVANHGVEAIDYFKNAEFDAILMDLHMPEMDGLEATRRIRALPKGNSVPIIAMTAAVMDEDKNDCLEAGMVDFIPKPVQIEQLIQVLCHWVKKEPFDAENHSKDEKIDNVALNINTTLKRLNGNTALLSRLLTDFINEHAQTIEQLNALLAKQEFETSQKLLHSIKGVSANLGASSLSQNASKLERQIKDGVELTAFPLFENAMQQTLTTIEEFNAKFLTTISDSDSSLSNQELLSLLESLRPYLENSDFLPESLLEPLRKIESQEPIKTRLKKLCNELDVFDYNGALTTLERIITTILDSSS